MSLVMCVGNFDPLHLGHIRHLQSARSYGSELVVCVCPDSNCRLKGADRPYFQAQERLEAVRALSVVDRAIISEPEDAIRLLCPDFYVKGPECRNSQSERLQREIALVQANCGRVVYTDDSIYSSTGLMEKLLRDLGI